LTIKEEISKNYNIKSNEAVILFKDFEEKPSIYDSQFEESSVKNFIKFNKLPDVVEFTPENAYIMFSVEINTHLILFINSTSSNFTDTINNFREASTKFKGKVIFTYIDANVKMNQEILDDFKIKNDTLPQFRIMSLLTNSTMLPNNNTISRAHFEEYVQEFFDMLGRPYFKSADLPEDWDKNPVKVLVGKNFHEVVHEKNKNKTVIVEFCKTFTIY
jgi:hypothetical protein